jgi:hypothetical protein
VHDGVRTDPDETGRTTGGRMPASANERLVAELKLDASAKDLFIAELNLLRQTAGKPSLNELVRLSQEKYTRSTIDDHLSGRRVMLPNWRLTSAYVSACHAAAKDTGLNVARLGTIEDWRSRWEAAQDGERSALSPIHESSSFLTHVMDDDDPAPSAAEEMSLKASTLTKLESKLHWPPRTSGSDDDSEVSPSVSKPSSGPATTESFMAIERDLEDRLSELTDSLPVNTGGLVVTRGPSEGEFFTITHKITTIGRDEDSDILLDDPTISRRHAVIHRRGSEFSVRDIGSRNGTFVHQRRIRRETAIGLREELQFGVYRMLFLQNRSS